MKKFLPGDATTKVKVSSGTRLPVIPVDFANSYRMDLCILAAVFLYGHVIAPG